MKEIESPEPIPLVNVEAHLRAQLMLPFERAIEYLRSIGATDEQITQVLPVTISILTEKYLPSESSEEQS